MRIKFDKPFLDRNHDSLKDVLCAKGFKSTRGREIILKEVETRGGHFNAETLYSGLRQKHQRVSKPTIYRTLKLLEKLRLVERFDIKKNCFYYEPLLHTEEHGHLICEECGRIVDFAVGDFNTIKSDVFNKDEFMLASLSIRAFGLCQECQKAAQTAPGET